MHRGIGFLINLISRNRVSKIMEHKKYETRVENEHTQGDIMTDLTSDVGMT